MSKKYIKWLVENNFYMVITIMGFILLFVLSILFSIVIQLNFDEFINILSLMICLSSFFAAFYIIYKPYSIWSKIDTWDEDIKSIREKKSFDLDKK